MRISITELKEILIEYGLTDEEAPVYANAIGEAYNKEQRDIIEVIEDICHLDYGRFVQARRIYEKKRC